MPLVTREDGREVGIHGGKAFPVEAYHGGMETFREGYLAWHWHDEFEFHLAEVGREQYTVGDTEYRLAPGDGVFINAGRPHMGRALDVGGVSHALVFHGRLLCDDALSDWYLTHVQQVAHNGPDGLVLRRENPAHRRVLDTLVTACYAYYDDGDPCHKLAAKAHLCLAWRDFLLCLPPTAGPVQREAGEHSRVKTLLGYIHAHYRTGFTLKQLAAAVNLSESECSRFFTKHIHQPPIAYLNRYRVEKSCDYLRDTGMPISQVALEVGYSSFSYYGKRFREVMGCTPRQYRALHHQRVAGE